MLYITRAQYWKLKAKIPNTTLLRLRFALALYFITIPWYPIGWLLDMLSGADATGLHVFRTVCDLFLLGVCTLALVSFRGHYDTGVHP